MRTMPSLLCGKFSGKAAGCLKGALAKSVYATPNNLIIGDSLLRKA